MVGWLDGWIVGWLDGWMVGMLECWNVGMLDGWTKGQVLMTICNFGGLGVVRSLGRESDDLDTIYIGEDAEELLQFGCDTYDGGRNALKPRKTCQIARRGNREASPEVSWELDHKKLTAKDIGLLLPWSCEVVCCFGCGRMDENEMNLCVSSTGCQRTRSESEE